MRLPDKCPHRVTAKHWVSHYEDALPCCRNDDFNLSIFLPRQAPMCRDIGNTAEAYRFVWRSSFHGDALVRIARGEKNTAVEWVCRGRHGDGQFLKLVAEGDWRRLEDALAAAEFWTSASEEEMVSVDGARWLIEGRRREVYQAIRRNSPRGPMLDLGRTFFEIAGQPIADFRLY